MTLALLAYRLMAKKASTSESCFPDVDKAGEALTRSS